MPLSFHLRASFITSHGVDCSRSCLAATGRMTSRANLRQYACHSCCSSLRRKFTGWKPLVYLGKFGLTDESIHPESYRLTGQPVADSWGRGSHMHLLNLSFGGRR